MQWLVAGAAPNDSLFFHCKLLIASFFFPSQRQLSPTDSGHGGQTKDLDGDEDDGYDEGQYTGFKYS
jgi:metacaspase-1